MNHIQKLTAELCPQGVPFVALGEVAEVNKGKQLNLESLIPNGLYPAYNGGTSYSGFTNTYNFDENTIIISQGGASAGFVNFVTTKFYANAHCFVVLPKKEIVLNRFLYHLLKLEQFNLMNNKHGAGIPALRKDIIETLLIPLPPLQVQKEIVNILDKFTTATTELQKQLKHELSLRQKQYAYYREQLLTFGDEVQWKTLGEVVTPTYNLKWTNNSSTYHYIDLSSVNRSNKRIFETTKINFENAPSRAQKVIHENDVIFATTRPTLQRYTLVPHEYSGQIASTGFCVLRADTNRILPKWIYYNISGDRFNLYVENKQSGSTYPAISDIVVKNFLIPLPPLHEQQRIVDILDKFDTLCTSLTEGLPKEIELRQKQYEYYRELLLTFEK